MTLLLKINPGRPERGRIRRAAQAIREGGLVVFPTETVYGIGASALDSAACRKIYKAKGRAGDNPLIVHVSDMRMADEVAEIPKQYRKAISRIWPAPITFIVRAKGGLPRVVTAGLDTVALRMPSNKVALFLIKESGVPIAAPSANISKKPSSTSARHALGYFKGKVDIIIDSGRSNYGMESTILDLRSFTLLRPGAFTAEQIERTFGRKPRISKEAKGEAEVARAISPGTKYRHYSPDTPLFLYTGRRRNLTRALSGAKGRFAFVGSDESCNSLRGMHCGRIRLGSSRNLREVARNLFDRLIALDSMGLDFAVVESFSESRHGLAIMNRLRKATRHRSFSDADGLRLLTAKRR